MNDISMQQALAEIRQIAAQVNGSQAVDAASEKAGPGFAEVLKQAIHGVNDQQTRASGMADAFARGEEVSLSEVMVAGQQARVSFEAVKQVRNQLLEAYQEVSRMQI